MRRLRAFFVRLASVFGRSRQERELAEELEGHLQMHIDDNLRAGMTPEAARRDAILKLGGVEATKEKYRERRNVPVLETLLRDVGLAARTLRSAFLSRAPSTRMSRASCGSSSRRRPVSARFPACARPERSATFPSPGSAQPRDSRSRGSRLRLRVKTRSPMSESATRATSAR